MMGGIGIHESAIKVKIESLGREINYGTPGISRTLRLLTVKDDEGNEFKAMAWGKMTKDLSKGTHVFVMESGSQPKDSLKNYFVLRSE
jgi:hypothetical protein